VVAPPSTRIELRDYDPAWPAMFEQEAECISLALGPGAIAVHHVGSTSVPGLAAKPIIDILLVVTDSAGEPSYVPALEAAGYRLHIREPHWHEHRLLKGTRTSVNLHVFSVGCPEIDRMLRFRDRLRASRDDRGRYLATKQALAAREWPSTQHYADAKGAIIEEILARAAV